MNNFLIDYVGCSRRSLDCQRLKNYLLTNGFTQVWSPKKADYLFIVTCGFHKSKEDDSIALIKKIQTSNGNIIVCGCLPIMNPVRLKKVFDGISIATKNIDAIDELFPQFRYKFRSSPDANWLYVREETWANTLIQKYCKRPHDFPKRILRKLMPYLIKNEPQEKFKHIIPNKKIFTIRIAEGCLGKCSYCNVRKAVGILRSKPIETIMEELRQGLSNGFYRVNIIAPDTGAYGLDNGSNIIALLNAILDEKMNIIIEYLEDIKPIYVCRYKKGRGDLIRSNRIKSMVVPVESASKRILKLMKRPCDLAGLNKVAWEMKKENQELRLATRVMIGFPTETAKDFQATIDYMKETPFEEIDVHHYHETEKTDSAKLFPKIDQRIIKERAEMLRKELSGKMQINPDPS